MSKAETQPKHQPALLRLSAMISQQLRGAYFLCGLREFLLSNLHYWGQHKSMSRSFLIPVGANAHDLAAANVFAILVDYNVSNAPSAD
jgi:hypothetical protein